MVTTRRSVSKKKAIFTSLCAATLMAAAITKKHQVIFPGEYYKKPIKIEKQESGDWLMEWDVPIEKVEVRR